MLKRYNIWDKKTSVITPVGEVITAEQWMDRYPVAKVDETTIVCGAGVVNGSFFGVLQQMVQMSEAQGCDFSDCTTDIERLERYEEFEDTMNQPDPNYVSDETRIADALQDLVVLNMPDNTEQV